MEVKKVQVEGREIAYYESTGTGPAILLVHGNSCSGLTYQHQVEGPLGEKYRVVAMDLPGHGDSDPAPDPAAYSMPGYAAVVAAVAGELEMEDAVLVGWSLGGHIILEAHRLLPDAAGFVIYGTPPLAFPPAMEEAFLPNPAMEAAFAPELSREQMEAFVAACLAPDSDLDPAPGVADMARTDGRARAGLAASIVPGGYADEIEIVANLDRPLAVLHGEQEQLVNLAYIQKLAMPTLWRGEVQVIEGAGHSPHLETPEKFNALLATFAEGVSGEN